MQKHVIVFSKNQNWCIYNVEVEQEFGSNGAYYVLDSKVHNSSVMGRKYYQIPSALNYRKQLNAKYIFDSKEDAQAAIDSLLRDNIIETMAQKERQILFLQEEIEKLKKLKPKGRYRNFLKVKTTPP